MIDQRYIVAKKILDMLEGAGFHARFAGGCVRDRILGRAPKDFDIATNAVPKQVLDVAKKGGLKAVPTGIDHGTVTLIKNSVPIEVTTLRADVDTDGRHATVKFGASFEEDAARRDFTVNAMFEDGEGKIYDYFGGREDIQSQTLKFVGDPEKRILEDYLRIMRLFRFWAELGFEPPEQTLHILTKQTEGLKKISAERVWGELDKILAIGDLKVHKKMEQMGIFEIIFDISHKKDKNIVKNSDLFTEVPLPQRSLFRLAAMAQNADLKADHLQKALRLSNAKASLLHFLLSAEHSLRDARRSTASALKLLQAWRGVAPDLPFEAWLLFAKAQIGKAPSEKTAIENIRSVCLQFAQRLDGMPLGAEQIMKHLQIKPGPDLGYLLHAVEEAYLNGEWASEAQGLAWLERHRKS